MTAYFRFRGRLLELEGNDEIVRFAAAAFGAMRCRRTGSVDHHACAFLNGTLRVTFDGTCLTIPAAARDEAPFYITREIFARFAASDPTGWAAYGAAIEISGRAIVMLAPSASGKTVLALHLTAGGARLYGDETFVIDRRDGSIHGMPRALMVRESALPLLPDDRMRAACRRSPHALETPRGRVWYALDPKQMCGPHSNATPATIAAIVLLVPDRSTTMLEPIEAHVAAMELTRRLYKRPAELRELAALTALCNRTEAYRLRVADPGEAAALLVERSALCA